MADENMTGVRGKHPPATMMLEIPVSVRSVFRQRTSLDALNIESRSCSASLDSPSDCGAYKNGRRKNSRGMIDVDWSHDGDGVDLGLGLNWKKTRRKFSSFL